jgi:hypothetical protein
MKRNIFGINVPSETALKAARDFVGKYPAASKKDYLRRFASQYGNKLSTKKFIDVLVRLFDALEK